MKKHITLVALVSIGLVGAMAYRKFSTQKRSEVIEAQTLDNSFIKRYCAESAGTGRKYFENCSFTSCKTLERVESRLLNKGEPILKCFALPQADWAPGPGAFQFIFPVGPPGGYFWYDGKSFQLIRNSQELRSALGPFPTQDMAIEFLRVFYGFRVDPAQTKIRDLGDRFEFVDLFQGEDKPCSYVRQGSLVFWKDGKLEMDSTQWKTIKKPDGGCPMV